MLFNSLQYLVFLPVMVLVYYLIPKTSIRNLWLLVGSYYFYMNWNARYALLLFSATAVTYLGALIISRLSESNASQLKRRACLIVCLCINLGILGIFKYSAMVIGWINNIFVFSGKQLIQGFDLILPVGISFFTLQAVGYLIDVYRGDIACEKNFFTYALFVSFFPQLVAGPIERSKNLLIQLKTHNSFKYENIQRGIYYILYGLMVKMVIADNLAMYVDAVYSDTATYSGWYIVTATIAFAFQIYCDFYGYSIIAKGSACLLGINLMSNFEAPYLAKSVQEFWRRWHISLSTWFRDYLYIPLGGNKNGTIRKYINLFIVFAVSGLWHGAAFSFILWGIINGVYQILGDVKKKIFRQENSKAGLFSRKLLSTVTTFILIDLAWLFFRAGSWSQAKLVINSFITNINSFEGLQYSFITAAWGLPVNMIQGVIIAIIILGVIDFRKYHNVAIVDKIIAQDVWFRYVVVIALSLFILVYGCYGDAYNPQQFIYFQF